MPVAAAQPSTQSRSSPASALLDELQSTYAELGKCMDQLQQLLDQPTPDLVRLTTVRLRLAHLRLTRGPLVDKIAQCLAGKLSSSEAAALQEMRSAHQCLLEAATAHTGKWTLDAVRANWPEYRRATREVARRWLERAKADQQLLYPLVKKQV